LVLKRNKRSKDPIAQYTFRILEMLQNITWKAMNPVENFFGRVLLEKRVSQKGLKNIAHQTLQN
jgi:hypothetical protein